MGVIQTGKAEIKLLLFTDDKTFYVEDPKDFTKILLELISELNKVKVNTQKSVAFLYINNEQSKKEIT